jgi:invasion protein IalB
MSRLLVAVSAFLAVFAVAAAGQAAQDPPREAKIRHAQKMNPAYSGWTRSCTKSIDVGGKEICFVTRFGRATSGKQAVAIILVEREGESQRGLSVLLPLEMQMVHGTRILIDGAKLGPNSYLFCEMEGCVSDYQATPDVVNKLRSGKNLIVQAIASKGRPLSFAFPLAGFDSAFSGQATDWNLLDGQQKKILTSLFRLFKEPGLAVASPRLVFTPWEKFCLKGKDTGAKPVCFTGRDGRTKSGQGMIATVVIEPKEESKKILRLTLPLGVDIATGTYLIVDGRSSAPRPYVICLANGCMSDHELTPALLASLRKGRTLIVDAMIRSGRPLQLAMPLDNFEAAYDGPPVERRLIGAQQK